MSLFSPHSISSSLFLSHSLLVAFGREKCRMEIDCKQIEENVTKANGAVQNANDEQNAQRIHIKIHKLETELGKKPNLFLVVLALVMR